MAHYAKVTNGKVVKVIVAEASFFDNFIDDSPGEWIQTSYNTRGNKYYNADSTEGDQSKKLRGNYAGIGYSFDDVNDIFWAPQPHASWTKNNSTATWDSPIAYPSVTDDGQDPVVFTYTISWNETGYQADNSKGWEATKSNDSGDPATIHDWNGSAWVSR